MLEWFIHLSSNITRKGAILSIILLEISTQPSPKEGLKW